MVSGSIKAVRYRPDGKEILIHRISPGEVFAEVPSLLGAQYPVTAIAETNSQVATLPLSKLKMMIAARPELALALLAALADKLRMLVAKIEERTALSMPARIAHRLLELSNNRWIGDTVEIELHQTKQSLAQECGTVSEVLSRTFASWKKQNLLSVNRSKLILQRRSKWEQIASDELN
ncbi:MAG: Crp/Fnr family transcriptional regulator [bacterium]|nr:Crp/Fnr family transcriptional regulator [bacterium]